MSLANQEISEETSKTILKGISIPPQPQLMVDLQIEMLGEHTSIKHISEIISKDIGISGSVLKTVNSPFFGLQSKITSIRQALNLLGIPNVVNIVNAISLKNTLTFQSILELTKVWDSSMDVAMAAAAISKRLGLSTSDEAYSLGLFHNCGIALLMDRHNNYLKVLAEAYAEKELQMTEIENRLLGTNHAVVGYFVAKAWKLPDHVCHIIADHHKSVSIFSDKIHFDQRSKDLLSVLKLAEHACSINLTLGNQEGHFEFEAAKHNLLLHIGLSEYDLEDLLTEIRELHVQ